MAFGVSTTSQLLNLTQHIEDGFERGQITGAVFVDLSAAYDTVNHRRLLAKVLEMTRMFTSPGFYKPCSRTEGSLLN